MPQAPLKILLASPRGFCAGVERAILVVERALEKYGAPVYVRHEIVHNTYVVDTLAKMGAVFVEELDEVPAGRPVVFSAHGVPKSVPAAAEARELLYVDATCPLVSKVHVEAERHFKAGRKIILIGHANHPEVIGTMGQLPPEAMVLVQSVSDVDALDVEDPDNLAYVTQTTLSVDDTQDIVNALRRKFPNLPIPRKEDICYATTNRQAAVKSIAGRCDVIIVVGSPSSSNSNRLVEVAQKCGCQIAVLVEDESHIDWSVIKPGSTVGVTAGASAPEVLVAGVIAAARARFDVSLEEVAVTTETVKFSLPRVLND